MPFEKPQKGNPHGLTVMQHTFPRASIARFVDDDGRVAVFHIPTKKHFPLSPTDQLFCAKRAWDQRAEDGFMKKIEDAFQSLADAIVAGRVRHIGISEKAIVSDFFALWNIRAHRKSRPIPDHSLNVVALERNLTQDQQELLEKNHVSVVRPDGVIPGRQLAGMNIQTNLHIVRRQLADALWGILTASEGEFIVPDNFSNARIVPVSPTICLFSQSEDEVISRAEVAEINQLAITSSVEYYFARDFSACPL